jgi:hypothetical protein
MSTKKSDAKRTHAQSTPIIKHYRQIGPAAVLAAVLAVKKRTQTSAVLPAKA